MKLLMYEGAREVPLPPHHEDLRSRALRERASRSGPRAWPS